MVVEEFAAAVEAPSAAGDHIGNHRFGQFALPAALGQARRQFQQVQRLARVAVRGRGQLFEQGRCRRHRPVQPPLRIGKRPLQQGRDVIRRERFQHVDPGA